MVFPHFKIEKILQEIEIESSDQIIENQKENLKDFETLVLEYLKTCLMLNFFDNGLQTLED